MTTPSASKPASVPTASTASKPAAPKEPKPDPDAICWCCAGPTVKRHCKIVCTNCGFMRDCSDP